MGFKVTTELFDQDGHSTSWPVGRTEITARDWQGVWDAVESVIGEYGLPSGSEGWGEAACVTSGHDCGNEPEVCKANGAQAVKEWIREALEDAGHRKIDFVFSGKSWAAVTATYDWE